MKSLFTNLYCSQIILIIFLNILYLLVSFYLLFFPHIYKYSVNYYIYLIQISRYIPDLIADLAMSDILYHVENRGKTMSEMKV